MMVGHGGSTPQGMFIVDGGSTADESSKRVLSGYSERSLQQKLAVHSLSTRNFWYTGLIKERILTHKANEEIWSINIKKLTIQYQNVLINEIIDLKPHLLIPMGELAFRFLTGLKGIQKYRGSVIQTSTALPFPKKKVLPILGPQPYWNQEYSNQLVADIDFTKIKNLLNDDPPPEFGYNIWVCKSGRALFEFLKRQYTPDGVLYFDIETYGGVPTCVSFCFGKIIEGKLVTTGESCCIPYMDQTINGMERAIMFKQVLQVLASPIAKVNQNIKYDWMQNEKFGIKVTNIVGDTLLGINCIYSEFPKNLGFQTSIYTDIPYFKDEGKQFNPNSPNTKDQLYLYNAKDSLAVSIIYPQQLDEMEYFKTRPVYDKLIQLIPIVKRMEEVGFRIDGQVRLAKIAKYSSLLRIEALKLKMMVGHLVNFQSPKQVDNLIFNEMGYTKIRGVKGTDEKSLQMLIAYGSPKGSNWGIGQDILQCILDCRKLSKVLEFLQANLHPDGRFRGSINLAGTENGRTSGGKTSDSFLYFDDKNQIDEEYIGHSGQTIGKHGFQIDGRTLGKDLRDMFVADYGYTLVGFDLQSAEARVDTILSGDFDILEVFNSKTGIHRLTGSWVYNCEPSDIKKNILVDGYDRYHISKQVRHAGERNMGADMLMMMVRLPIKSCEGILTTFHNKQPNIRLVFHNHVRQIVNKDRRLVAPNGRQRIFMGRAGKDMENEAISFLPQTIVGDQTKFSMIPIMERFTKVIPMIEAHDGVLFQVPKGQEVEFMETCKPMIETPIDFRNGSLVRDYLLTIPTEWEQGECWGNLEEMQ